MQKYVDLSYESWFLSRFRYIKLHGLMLSRIECVRLVYHL